MSPTNLIQSSSLPWLMATGLLLGALHAMEPGHAKTLIASFVVATRGSVPQAVLLGMSAAISHSLLIWVLAGAALYFGDRFIGDEIEPWLQLASGIVIVIIGLTMIWRLQRRGSATRHGAGPRGGQLIETGNGAVELTVEDGVAAEFRLCFYDTQMRVVPAPAAAAASVRTVRPDGTAQVFAFSPRGEHLVSTDPIPEPHEFEAVLSLPHGDHTHDHMVAFAEPHGHGHGHHPHGHPHPHPHPHDHEQHRLADAHADAHARQIAGRFDGRPVTTGQIAWFGLSSGLIPCPAALTMLLVCLRLKRITLGIGLVGAFSFGLAVTLVALGVVASLGVKSAARYLPGLDRWTGDLPYLSGAMVIAVGVFMGVSGFSHLG